LHSGSIGFATSFDARASNEDTTHDTNAKSWVEGSLFFEAQDLDGILDDSLSRGIHLDLEHVRDALGLSKRHISSISELLKVKLGAHIKRVSTMHDWMHISLPLMREDWFDPIPSTDARLRRFLENNASPNLKRVAYQLASALQAADLDHLVSHVMLVPNDSEGDDPAEKQQEHVSLARGQLGSRSAATTRRLQQDSSAPEQQQQGGSAPENRSKSFVLGSGVPEIFTDDDADAIQHMGTWQNSQVALLECEGEEAPYLVGKNTESCFLGLDIVLQPMTGVPGASSSNPVTIRFDAINQFGKTCAELPDLCSKLNGSAPITDDTYIYGIPIYKYTKPNVLYSGSTIFTLNTSQGAILSRNELPTVIFNYYNASALTIRDLYGVDPSLQGSSKTVQASMLSIGNEYGAVNTTAVNQYLGFLGLEPHSELRIREFGVPNNLSACAGSDNCLESMLDTQTLQSFAPNATTYFTPSSQGSDPKEVAQLLLSFLDDALNATPRTQVASLSWTWNYVNTAELPIESLEGYLKKLAAVGMTIVVASGDSGAAASGSGCYPPGQGGQLIGNKIGDAWPAVSPWITSVGGTQLLGLGKNLETEEVACSVATNGGITSGGGFSGTWLNVSTPSWQLKAVKNYLENNNAKTFSGFPTETTVGYNPNGRGFPDISAYGAYFPILTPSGDVDSVSGTSLSAPLAASLFTLANQKLLEDGYKLIGYANPMLYWMAEKCPQAFNDITMGDNQSNQNGDLCQYGFPAAIGWDPVTGLGSINFGNFVACAKKYQDKRPR
jgi:hypothetical protein